MSYKIYSPIRSIDAMLQGSSRQALIQMFRRARLPFPKAFQLNKPPQTPPSPPPQSPSPIPPHTSDKAHQLCQ